MEERSTSQSIYCLIVSVSSLMSLFLLAQAFHRNVTSFYFWFDCVTSMPWSYLDYDAYLVST